MNATATKFALVLCLVFPVVRAQPQPEPATASRPSPEQLEKLAISIIADIRAKVAAKAVPKDFDSILEQLNEVSSTAVQVPSPTFPGRFTVANQLPPKFEAARTFVVRWQEYRASVEKGNFFMARQTLLAIGQDAVTGYAILPRSELMALQDSLAVEQRTAYKKITDPLIAELGEAMLSVEAPDEFNAIIGKIETALETTRGDPTVDGILRGLRNYAAAWRNYFVLATGGGATAPQVSSLIEPFNTDTNGYAIELRKKAAIRVQKLNATPVAAKVSEGADPNALTLENVETYIANVGKNDGGNTLNFLNSVLNLRNRSAAGDLQFVYEFYGARSNAGGYGTPPQFEAAVDRIRTKLVLEALAIQFNPAGIKPAANEKVADFLARGIAAEIKAKRWNAVIEALQVAQFLNPRRQNNYDLAAYQKLVVGINQERARQYADAKRSYLEALAIPGTYIPVEELTERLNSKEIAQADRSIR